MTVSPTICTPSQISFLLSFFFFFTVLEILSFISVKFQILLPKTLLVIIVVKMFVKRIFLIEAVKDENRCQVILLTDFVKP